MNTSQISKLHIPLGVEAHKVAKKFASEQTSSGKFKQVYLNTLSVYAAHRYLKWLGVKTILTQSDCWNPIFRSRWNIADLVIPAVGTMECRPVLPGENDVLLPEEATEDRSGYLAIQFDECLEQVQPLGFARNVPKGILAVRNLLPLEAFIEATVPAPNRSGRAWVSAWVTGIFDNAWQPLTALLSPQHLALAVKSGRGSLEERISRAKRLNLTLPGGDIPLNLVIHGTPKENQEFDIRVEVSPVSPQNYLPVGLKVKVGLETGGSREFTAKENDEVIRISLMEDIGQSISVEISFENVTVNEEILL